MTETRVEPPNGPVELPDPLATTFQTLAGLDEPPATFTEWMGRATSEMEGDPVRLTANDLYVDGPTPHEVYVDDARHFVPCVLDALEIPVLVTAPAVEIRSESPYDGSVVEIDAEDDGIAVTPEDAVMSFGVSTAHELDADGEGPPIATWIDPDSNVDVEPRICQHTNAFVSERAYEAWASEQSAVDTVSMTIAEGWTVAKRAAESGLFDR